MDNQAGKKSQKCIKMSSKIVPSEPIVATLGLQTSLVTLSDATFGPLILLDVTFEPRQALLGGPRPSRVMAPDQIESLRERMSDQTKQDDMIRRRNKKSIYIYIYTYVHIGKEPHRQELA